jgi:hypothetical protein
MDIKIYRKSNYGKTSWYVLDENESTAILLISGMTTLTDRTRLGLEKLGFTFTEVIAP